MSATYSYNPEKLKEKGKDLMRFELGDTMVEGREKTCALADEEYEAMISMHKKWKRAKLACLESIFRRFSYEPDTSTGPLSFKFGDRAKLWQEEYEKLKKEVAKEFISSSSISAQMHCGKPPYFYTGMMSRDREGG